MESEDIKPEPATERLTNLPEAGSPQADPDNQNSGADDPSTQSGHGTSKKGKKRELSKAELAWRKKARRAKAYPHGPEAKALAEAEPKMPESLCKKIELSDDRNQWAEAFDWLIAEMRAKVRGGGLWHGKRLCEAIVDSNPAVRLNEAEKAWLIAWLGYFHHFKKELRSGGKYGPKTDVLKVIGVADEADCWLAQIDALDDVTAARPIQSAGAPPASTSQSPGGRPAESHSETSETLPRPDVSPVRSIQDLPPTPRDLPLSFTKLDSSIGKEFRRAYSHSDDLGEILTAARAFGFDPWAVTEVRNLGTEARTFFDETMLKLGIPLP